MRRNIEMMNHLAGRERMWVDFSTDKPLRLGCVTRREQCSACNSLPVDCSSGECGRAELMCLSLQGNQIPICGISLSRSTGVFCPGPDVTVPDLGFLPKIASCRSQNKTKAHCCVCCSSVHPGPCKLQSRQC